MYAAGFVTAFGAHAVAANLGGYGAEHHISLWQLGLLLGVYDGAEVVLKPVFGALSDRVGAKPVLVGGLVGFALASVAFVAAGNAHWLGVARLGQGAAAAAFSPQRGPWWPGWAARNGPGGYSAATAGPRASATWPALWPEAPWSLAGGYCPPLRRARRPGRPGGGLLGPGAPGHHPRPPAALPTVADLARQVTHPRFLRNQ